MFFRCRWSHCWGHTCCILTNRSHFLICSQFCSWCSILFHFRLKTICKVVCTIHIVYIVFLDICLHDCQARKPSDVRKTLAPKRIRFDERTTLIFWIQEDRHIPNIFQQLTSSRKKLSTRVNFSESAILVNNKLWSGQAETR